MTQSVWLLNMRRGEGRQCVPLPLQSPRCLEAETCAEQEATIELLRKPELLLVAGIGPDAFFQQVDTLQRDRDLRRDLIADRGVELPEGGSELRIARALAIDPRQEPVAPVIGDT